MQKIREEMGEWNAKLLQRHTLWSKSKIQKFQTLKYIKLKPFNKPLQLFHSQNTTQRAGRDSSGKRRCWKQRLNASSRSCSCSRRLSWRLWRRASGSVTWQRQNTYERSIGPRWRNWELSNRSRWEKGIMGVALFHEGWSVWIGSKKNIWIFSVLGGGDDSSPPGGCPGAQRHA